MLRAQVRMPGLQPGDVIARLLNQAGVQYLGKQHESVVFVLRDDGGMGFSRKAHC